MVALRDCPCLITITHVIVSVNTQKQRPPALLPEAPAHIAALERRQGSLYQTSDGLPLICRLTKQVNVAQASRVFGSSLDGPGNAAVRDFVVNPE